MHSNRTKTPGPHPIHAEIMARIATLHGTPDPYKIDHLDIHDPNCTVPTAILDKLCIQDKAIRERNFHEQQLARTAPIDIPERNPPYQRYDEPDWSPQPTCTLSPQLEKHQEPRKRFNPFHPKADTNNNEPNIPSTHAITSTQDIYHAQANEALTEMKQQKQRWIIHSPPLEPHVQHWLRQNKPTKEYSTRHERPMIKPQRLSIQEYTPSFPRHDEFNGQWFHNPLQLQEEAYNHRAQLALNTSRTRGAFLLKRGEPALITVRPTLIHAPGDYYTFSLRGDNADNNDTPLEKCTHKHANLISHFCPFTLEAICTNYEGQRVTLTSNVSIQGHHTITASDFHHLEAFLFTPHCKNSCFGFNNDTILRLMIRGFAGKGHILNDFPVIIFSNLKNRTHADRENRNITIHTSIIPTPQRPEKHRTPYKNPPVFTTTYLVTHPKPESSDESSDEENARTLTYNTANFKE
jgi:hypothetical protein